ncbi:helix-turn-helix domain-containing protein [Brevibacterium picturae]|uniref:Helix-turn-helix domain-containing protein n=1 Tax=Brevibacterium picturae TaxID=260553 RepID=A0ABP4LW41_9MICO
MASENRSQATTPQLVSLAEAADQFGISVKTLRRRISDGTIHGYRVGRLIRVDMNELRARLMVEMPTSR